MATTLYPSPDHARCSTAFFGAYTLRICELDQFAKRFTP